MQAAAPRDEAAPNGGGDPKNQEWAQERITRLLGRVQASYGDDLERLVTLTWRVMAACNGDHAAADAGMSSDDARHPVKRLVLDAKEAGLNQKQGRSADDRMRRKLRVRVCGVGRVCGVCVCVCVCRGSAGAHAE